MHQIFLTSFEDLWKTMKRSSMVFPCPLYCLSSLIVVQFTNCELPWRTGAPGPGSYPSQRKYDTHHVMRWYVLYWAWGSTVESSWLTRSIKISLVLWYSSLSDHVHLDLHWYLNFGNHILGILGCKFQKRSNMFLQSRFQTPVIPIKSDFWFLFSFAGCCASVALKQKLVSCVPLSSPQISQTCINMLEIHFPAWIWNLGTKSDQI